MRPSVSMPARPLYAQRVPGWKSRGAAPSAAVQSATVPVVSRGAMRPAACASRAAAHQARRVGDQVMHRDLAIGRHGVDGALPARGVGSRHRDLRVAELRDEARHGVGQTDLPLFHEHQDGDAGHRLRHRGDGEDGVLLHRGVRLEVHQPVRLEMRYVPAPRDDGDGPGDLVRIDGALDHLADPLQALRGQPHVVRLPGRYLGQRGRDREQGDEDEYRRQPDDETGSVTDTVGAHQQLLCSRIDLARSLPHRHRRHLPGGIGIDVVAGRRGSLPSTPARGRPGPQRSARGGSFL